MSATIPYTLHAVNTPLEIPAEQDLDLLVEMLRDASQSPDARQVLASFVKRLWTVNPIDALVSLSIRSMPEGHYKITRSIRREELDLTSKNIRLPDPWTDWDTLPSHRQGFLADLIRGGRPQMFHHLKLGDDPVIGERLGDMRSAVATPLFDAGEPLNWNLQLKKDPRGFSENDLSAHVLQANLIGSITRNLIAVQREASLKKKLQHQLDELASVQRALLPTTLPNIPGLRIAASYLTSDQAGGDYYDFVELPGGQWGMLIADVAGHGAAAAAVMAMLHAIVHSYQGEHSLEGIVSYTNRQLFESSIEGRFATAVFGYYDPATSVYSYVRAGHNPPKLKAANGQLRDLDGAATLPLGVLETLDFKSECVKLSPGDTLVFYTDGITEAFSPHKELFGIERLDRALQACDCQPEHIIESVHREIHEHTRRLDRDDDQTLVILQHDKEATPR